MKKTLIALAAVAVTSTAFAQNVTISGRLDMGTASAKTTDRDAGEFAGEEKRSTLAGQQNAMTTGRITFAGTEDLGGGLKAGFNIESAINNSTIGGRNLFLNLSGSFGTVQIGRYLNAFSAVRSSTYSVAGAPGGDYLSAHIGLTNGNDAADRFGIATTELDFVDAGSGLDADGRTETEYNARIRGANAAIVAQLNGLMSTGIGSRSNNALSYVSPSFNGFNLTVGLVNDKIQTRDENRDVEAQNKVSGTMYSIAYAAGPLSARLTTGSGKVRTQSAAIGANDFRGATAAVDESRAKVSDTAMIVSYNFGVAQAYVMTESTKGTLQQFRGADIDGAIQKTRASEIGVKMPMGAFEPFVTVSRGKIQAFADGEATNDVKTSAWQLGSKYNLSKRTYVYGAYGSFSTKSNDADLSEESSKTKGYAVGLVHQF